MHRQHGNAIGQLLAEADRGAALQRAGVNMLAGLAGGAIVHQGNLAVARATRVMSGSRARLASWWAGPENHPSLKRPRLEQPLSKSGKPMSGWYGGGAAKQWRNPRGRFRGTPNLYSKFHSKMCIEKKYHDNTTASTAMDGTVGVIASPLSEAAGGIAQGFTSETRVGARIFVWDMQLFITLAKTREVAASTVPTTIRILVVVDRQSNGLKPLYGDVIDKSHGSSVYAFRKLENVRRFQVLYDKTIIMNDASGFGNGTTNEVNANDMTIKFYKKWANGLKVVYDKGDATGYTDKILDNNIWVMAFNNSNEEGTVRIKSRIRYTD